MGLGAEAFTVLAILEARDKASEIFAKVDEALDKFSETAKSAGETASTSGEQIDAGLGKSAEGADKLAAAEQRAAAAIRELAAAKAELGDAAAEAAGDDADTAAADRLVTAQERVTAASAQEAAAQKVLGDAFLDATGKAGVYADAQGKLRDAQGKYVAGTTAADGATAASGLSLAKVGKVAGITALGLGVAGGLMVKAAGNFQDSTAHLQTDAGVTAGNLQMIRANILNVSTATGQSAESITNAMYHIASSGFTGANSLGILKAAAEGARVGGASLDTTSKALVGTLTAYYGTSLSAGQATKDSTSLMNQLIETVGTGDMRMQDLASSLASVTPVAAAAHVSFAQVGGAIATMTAQGMTAQRATQNLAHFIRSMQAPTSVQSTEMKALGLNANNLSKNLGTTGLAGTITQMRNAILSNTSGGSVFLGYLKEMTPAAQGLANQILSGSITTGDLTQAIKGLNPEQASLVTKFKAAAVSATGLKQTYTAAMSKMVGGATGLNVALMLSGKHMTDLTKNTAKIAAEGKKASGAVDNWSTIQGTFNFKVAQAKTAIENTGIAIGSALLPAVSTLFSGISKILIPIAEFTAKHKTLTEVVFLSVTGIAALVSVIALATKTFKAVKGAVDSVKSAVNGAVTAYQKLAGKSKAAADTQKTEASETAAVQEEKSAEAAAALEADAAEVAAANEEAAATSQGSWVRSAAGMIGSAVKWVAQSVAKVAVIVASNVAGAAVTAGAWIAANALMLGGILLVVAAVALAVYEIVTHWKTITTAVSKVWDDVFAYSKKIIGDVVSFIKAHWALIVGIFLGPIALVVALVIQHWALIEHYFQDGVNAVEKALSWFTGLQARFRTWLGGAASAVTSEGSKILHWFTSLPGLILSEVAKIPGMLFSSGERIIESLANGITSAAGKALHGAMGFVANTIKSFLPFSPAKQGPLSGAGDPSNSGKSIVGKLASGLTQGTSQAAAAAAKVAATVQAGLSGRGTAGIGSSLAGSAIAPAVGSGGNGGGTTVVIDVHGNWVMSDSDITKLTQKIGTALAKTHLPAAGRKFNIH